MFVHFWTYHSKSSSKVWFWQLPLIHFLFEGQVELSLQLTLKGARQRLLLHLWPLGQSIGIEQEIGSVEAIAHAPLSQTIPKSQLLLVSQTKSESILLKLIKVGLAQIPLRHFLGLHSGSVLHFFYCWRAKALSKKGVEWATKGGLSLHSP